MVGRNDGKKKGNVLYIFNLRLYYCVVSLHMIKRIVQMTREESCYRYVMGRHFCAEMTTEMSETAQNRVEGRDEMFYLTIH